jgi:hypothetical protein
MREFRWMRTWKETRPLGELDCLRSCALECSDLYRVENTEPSEIESTLACGGSQFASLSSTGSRHEFTVWRHSGSRHEFTVWRRSESRHEFTVWRDEFGVSGVQ